MINNYYNGINDLNRNYNDSIQNKKDIKVFRNWIKTN